MSVTEAAAAKGPLAGALAEGVDTLSLSQEVTFTRYVRQVFPLDGYVFWVKADLLSSAALLGALGMNDGELNSGGQVETPAATRTVKGSLHYASAQNQDEAESFTRNQIVFTALSPVQDLNEINPAELWLGEFDGLRFAFSARAKFYRQADLYHLSGDAIYPALETQIIDNPAQLDTRQLIVSNSLPVWLALGGSVPTFLNVPKVPCPVYPSFLVPDNVRPPYAAIHIAPEETRALQPVPYLNNTNSHFQLASDRVKVTLYGLTNALAADYQDAVMEYMVLYGDDVMGLMTAGALRDEKQTQNELSAIAMKKTWEVQVSYNQTAVRSLARQLILSCVPTYNIASSPLVGA